MPFQIYNIAAYRDLVLNELKKEASVSGTPTNEIVQNYVGNWADSGEPRYDWAILNKIKGAQGCYNSMSEVLWYSYCHAPLHFDALQTMMQIEENDAEDTEYGDTFRKKVFSADGDLLVVDVGCGPMTAGLALANWYDDAHHKPLKLSYVGIDNSEYCTTLASHFAARSELFDMQHSPLFYEDCSACDLDKLKARLTSNGTLLFMFSYILGQHTCKQEHLEKWALFVRQAMSACNAKHNLFVYINSPHNGKEDTNNRYIQFQQLLGWKHLPNDGFYAKRLLKRFNEQAGLRVMEEGYAPFRHLIVDATLVDENYIPVRKDKHS